MADQNEKQPTEMGAEKKAEIIGQKLKELQQKCANEDKKVCNFVNWTQTKFCCSSFLT